MSGYVQGYQIPVFPNRSTLPINGYRQNIRWYPNIRNDLPPVSYVDSPLTQPPPPPPPPIQPLNAVTTVVAPGCSKIVLVLVAAILLVVLSALVVALVLSQTLGRSGAGAGNETSTSASSALTTLTSPSETSSRTVSTTTSRANPGISTLPFHPFTSEFQSSTLSDPTSVGSTSVPVSTSTTPILPSSSSSASPSSPLKTTTSLVTTTTTKATSTSSPTTTTTTKATSTSSPTTTTTTKATSTSSPTTTTTKATSTSSPTTTTTTKATSTASPTTTRGAVTSSTVAMTTTTPRASSSASSSTPLKTTATSTVTSYSASSTVSPTTTMQIPSTTVCPVFCAPTNQCIPPSQVCDKYQDCPNDIDETNCTCDSDHYPCIRGRCIYKSWLCDGIRDCPLGDDESPQNCPPCNSTQFTCSRPHSCINLDQECDGSADCVDSSDESQCITEIAPGGATSASLVNVTYRGDPGYSICADNWNDSWSDAVCRHMGFQDSNSTSYVAVRNGSFLSLNPLVSSPNIMSHLVLSNCSSNRAVAVSCQSSDCGTRSVPPDSVGPYIINGQMAQPGAFPWQASHFQGTYSADNTTFNRIVTCGAILINDRWILTAAHCNIVASSTLGYSGPLRPENIQIQLGSMTLSGDSNMVRVRPDRVFVHPNYSTSPSQTNDIGMIRLSSPVTFTDRIRPICIPSADEDYTRLGVCVDTGFGRTIRNTASENLLQARMNILSYSECYDYIPTSYLRNDTQFCAGTVPTDGDINFCKGDSGGPLSCRDPSGIWKLMGINSYVIGIANGNTATDTCKISVCTRMTSFVAWVQQIMASNSV